MQVQASGNSHTTFPLQQQQWPLTSPLTSRENQISPDFAWSGHIQYFVKRKLAEVAFKNTLHRRYTHFIGFGKPSPQTRLAVIYLGWCWQPPPISSNNIHHDRIQITSRATCTMQFPHILTEIFFECQLSFLDWHSKQTHIAVSRN